MENLNKDLKLGYDKFLGYQNKGFMYLTFSLMRTVKRNINEKMVIDYLDSQSNHSMRIKY